MILMRIRLKPTTQEITETIELTLLTIFVVSAPTGLVNPKCTAFIGSGVVVHVPAFFEELENLTKKGSFFPPTFYSTTT